MTKKALRGRKKAMFEALCSTLGNVTRAAKKVGLDRSTHYAWLKDDPNYVAWIDEVSERQVDFYEEALNDLIEKRHPTAVIFALKTKGKHRGYVEKQEVEHSGELKSGLDPRSIAAASDIVARELEEMEMRKREEARKAQKAKEENDEDSDDQ